MYCIKCIILSVKRKLIVKNVVKHEKLKLSSYTQGGMFSVWEQCPFISKGDIHKTGGDIQEFLIRKYIFNMSLDIQLTGYSLYGLRTNLDQRLDEDGSPMP